MRGKDDRRGTVPKAGGIGGASFLMLSGLQVIFAISFAARLSCLSVLPMVGEIKIRQTQVAPVSYVFWQAVAVEPIRGIQSIIGFTFRYPAKVERGLRENAKSLRFRLKMRMGVGNLLPLANLIPCFHDRRACPPVLPGLRRGQGKGRF